MVIIEKNNEGLKYFMYFISQNTPSTLRSTLRSTIPYINTDIRKLIWNYAYIPFLQLCLNNDIKLNLYIYI